MIGGDDPPPHGLQPRIAVEELAAALHVYEKAKETDAGITVEFGGQRLEAD